MFQRYLPRSEHRSSLTNLAARVTGQFSAVLPFVVCNSLQALPHPTSVREGVVVRFDISPVLTLCLFDGSSQGITGFLISVPLLEGGSSTL